MDEADKGRLMTMTGVSGRMFLLVPAHPGCLEQNPDSHKTVVCVCERARVCVSLIIILQLQKICPIDQKLWI